ncbi:MAG: hypothetical protein QW622_00215 [Candidatus Pacearchaeota archaeon]
MRSIKNLEKVLLLTLGIGAGTLGCAHFPSITYSGNKITIKNEYKGDIHKEIEVNDICYKAIGNPLIGLKSIEEIPCDNYATNQSMQGQPVPPVPQQQPQSYQPTIKIIIDGKDNQKEPKKTQQESKPTQQKVVPPSKTPQEFGRDNFDIF